MRVSVSAWEGGPYDDETGEIYLDEGPHTIKIEYLEATGGARIHLWTEPLGR